MGLVTLAQVPIKLKVDNQEYFSSSWVINQKRHEYLYLFQIFQLFNRHPKSSKGKLVPILCIF